MLPFRGCSSPALSWKKELWERSINQSIERINQSSNQRINKSSNQSTWNVCHLSQASHHLHHHWVCGVSIKSLVFLIVITVCGGMVKIPNHLCMPVHDSHNIVIHALSNSPTLLPFENLCRFVCTHIHTHTRTHTHTHTHSPH